MYELTVLNISRGPIRVVRQRELTKHLDNSVPYKKKFVDLVGDIGN